ncbi:MAG: hypothetical protein ACI8RD_010168 [Bacillariaceae sp.]|jgi:hypothetical protein
MTIIVCSTSTHVVFVINKERTCSILYHAENRSSNAIANSSTSAELAVIKHMTVVSSTVYALHELIIW